MCSGPQCQLDEGVADAENVMFTGRPKYIEKNDNPYSDARIMDQIGFAREQLSKLHEQVRILENRIEILLIPEQEVTVVAHDGMERAMPTSTSELSGILNDLNVQIRHIALKVNTVTERIQL